jgi:hypothetical protein
MAPLGKWGLIVTVIVFGVAIRRVPLGLPPVVTKYAGSMLWALMIFLLVGVLLPALRLRRAALLAGAIATAVECFKLVHTPALDAFRLTLLGMLLLGRFFSWRDLVAYYAAIAVAAALRHRFLCRAVPSRL